MCSEARRFNIVSRISAYICYAADVADRRKRVEQRKKRERIHINLQIYIKYRTVESAK